MRTLSTPDGALPIATSLTSQPVGPLNFDQSPPGSPTPTSARVTDPLAAQAGAPGRARPPRSEEHTSELQSHSDLVCRLLLEKKNHRPRRRPTQSRKVRR